MSSKGHYYLIMHGHLNAHLDSEGYISWRFIEDAEEGVRGREHPINGGDLLKVYDADETLLWSGVVAYNYEMMSEELKDGSGRRVQKIAGKLVRGIQGSARPLHWLDWFTQGNRARLEIRIGEMNTHYADQKPQSTSEDPAPEGDRAVERERLIEDLINLHDGGNTAPEAKKPISGKNHWWDE